MYAGTIHHVRGNHIPCTRESRKRTVCVSEESLAVVLGIYLQCVNVCIYVCMYVCMHACMYVGYACVCVCVYVVSRINAYTLEYLDIHIAFILCDCLYVASIRVCIYVCVYDYRYVPLGTYFYLCMLWVHVCACAYLGMSTFT
jgi:hypothetical protein